MTMTTNTDPDRPAGIPRAAADPRPTTPDATASPSPFGRSLLASAVLSLACGGLGAWAYRTYAEKPTATGPPPESAGSPDVLQAPALDALEARMVRIQEQVAAILKGSSIAELETLTGRVAELDARLGIIDQARDSLHTEVASLEVPGGRAASSTVVVASTRKTAVGVHADGNVRDAPMGWGAELFARGKYADALQFFERLQASHPDDARVWYFSALAQGLNTNDWRGQTERIVRKGIACEQAGTPGTPRIDIAFTSLTAATGKEWLAAYRRSIQK